MGGTLKDNEVGPGIYADFLPAALATGAYRAAPKAVVVGDGLDAIPAAIEQLRRESPRASSSCECEDPMGTRKYRHVAALGGSYAAGASELVFKVRKQ